MSRTAVLRVGAILTVLATAACAVKERPNLPEGGPVNAGAGSVEAARKYLEGRWTLVSYQIFPPGKPAIPVTGSGTLLYDTHGNLDMQIRVDAATARTLDVAGIPSAQGVISVKGRTVVDMQAHTLTYVLEGQRPFDVPTGPLGTNRPRHWEVDGNVLTLKTKADDGQTILSEGRWQKLPK